MAQELLARLRRRGALGLRWLGAALIGLGTVGLMAGAADRGGADTAVVITLEGPIGPATADYFSRELNRAVERGAPVAILAMDTPGGLDVSMRAMIRDILDSPIPVVSYVHPSGARAASAGTFLSYAAHIAAMAPATNLGAATPVAIGGGSPVPAGDEGNGSDDSGSADGASGDGDGDNGASEAGDGEPVAPAEPDAIRDASTLKTVNDAVAYIRGLAELRGRNADWAERAVRGAEALSATEALEKNVIDLIARDFSELLDRIDGMTVEIGSETVTLATADLGLDIREPDWRTQFLNAITNPNVALILMLVGVYGLIFEFTNPGALLPGSIGVISLLTGLYALAALPLNVAGLALLVVGLLMILFEAITPAFGILGIAGIGAISLGATMLIDGEGPGYEVSTELIAAFALFGTILVLIVARLAARAFRARIVTGAEGAVGGTAEVLDWQGGRGHVFFEGERWVAVSQAPLEPGQTVTVQKMEGVKLVVAPVEQTDERISHAP